MLESQKALRKPRVFGGLLYVVKSLVLEFK